MKEREKAEGTREERRKQKRDVVFDMVVSRFEPRVYLHMLASWVPLSALNTQLLVTDETGTFIPSN